MSKVSKKVERPLSPHLQIYRPQISSVLSILHRMTGVGLSFGLFFLAAFLGSLVCGAEGYEMFSAFCGTIIGKLLLLGFFFALFYHVCSGLRHLMWDSGKGFDIPSVNRTGWMVVIASIGGTLCYVLYLMRLIVQGG